MTAQRKDRRQSFRFDKAFPVYLSGDEGVTRGIAISTPVTGETNVT